MENKIEATTLVRAQDKVEKGFPHLGSLAAETEVFGGRERGPLGTLGIYGDRNGIRRSSKGMIVRNYSAGQFSCHYGFGGCRKRSSGNFWEFMYSDALTENH